MTTSNSYNFNSNRDELILATLQLLGVNDPASGLVPTPEQISQAASAANMMIQAWAADGLPLWSIKKHEFSLTNTAKYTNIGLGIPKPLRIIAAYRHNTLSNIDVPINILTRAEYNLLPNKGSTVGQGIPVSLYYDPQLDTGEISIWPFPSAQAQSTERINIIYHRSFQDFDAATDTPDFPKEWLNALKWGLAAELCYGYGLTEKRITMIQNKAKETHKEALSYGMEEGSITFSVSKY